MRRIVNTKPIWIDQDLFAEWTKGGEVLFSKVDKSLDCYWVLARFNHDLEGQSQGSKFTLQLQRYFKIGDECMISCDAHNTYNAEREAVRRPGFRRQEIWRAGDTSEEFLQNFLVEAMGRIIK